MRAFFSLVLLTLASSIATAAQAPQQPANPPSDQDQTYTLRTQANVVLVPTTVQTNKGDMLYDLKPEQFVVEDNGVPQTIHLDEDTDSLGLSLAVVVQCSREAFMEFSKFEGLGTMIDAISGGAPREVALIVYGGKPVLVGDFSADPDAIHRALAQLQPCDDPEASTLDAVAYAAGLLEARKNHFRHA